MTDILNLPNWAVLSVEDQDGDYHIRAECLEKPKACPRCGVVSPKLHGYGGKEQVFMDLPIHGKRTGILCQRNRYKCLECGKTFFQPLAAIDDAHRATKRLVAYAKKESLSRTFASVANEVGVDEKTIRILFHEHVKELEEKHQFITPEYLGIDEIHILNKPRCVLGSIQERTIVDILKNRNQKLVAIYLTKMPQKERVEIVSMDMWKPYREAVRAVMPRAQVVVDKFHILRMANQSLDAVRKSIREGLTPKQKRQLMHDRFILLRRNADLKPDEQMILQLWTDNFPLLGEAYWMKEDFFKVWDCSSRGMALAWYGAWRQRLIPDLEEFYAPLLTAIENWKPEIFAYFDYPVTNAYTEALNGIIKLIQRVGRGYSFDAIRAKVLYSEGLHKRVRPNFRRMLREEEAPYLDNIPFQFLEQQIDNPAGVDISTLGRMLQEELDSDDSTRYSA